MVLVVEGESVRVSLSVLYHVGATLLFFILPSVDGQNRLGNE